MILTIFFLEKNDILMIIITYAQTIDNKYMDTQRQRET